MMQTLVPILLGFLLAAIVGAMIFSTKFRKDLLGGEGEARILGILSIKGAAVVVLCGLFVGGLLYSVPKAQEAPSGFVSEDLLNLLAANQGSALREADQNAASLRGEYRTFVNERWMPLFMANFVRRADLKRDIRDTLNKPDELDERITEFTKFAVEEVLRREDELLGLVDSVHKKSTSRLREWYNETLIAVAGRNVEEYRELLKARPPELDRANEMYRLIDSDLRNLPPNEAIISSLRRLREYLAQEFDDRTSSGPQGENLR